MCLHSSLKPKRPSVPPTKTHFIFSHHTSDLALLTLKAGEDDWVWTPLRAGCAGTSCAWKESCQAACVHAAVSSRILSLFGSAACPGHLRGPSQNLVCSWYSVKSLGAVGSERRQGESQGKEKPSAKEHTKPESRLLFQCLW